MDDNELKGFKYAVMKSMIQNICLLICAMVAFAVVEKWWAFLPLVLWTAARHTDDKDKPKETKS